MQKLFSIVPLEKDDFQYIMFCVDGDQAEEKLRLMYDSYFFQYITNCGNSY